MDISKRNKYLLNINRKKIIAFKIVQKCLQHGSEKVRQNKGNILRSVKNSYCTLERKLSLPPLVYPIHKQAVVKLLNNISDKFLNICVFQIKTGLETSNYKQHIFNCINVSYYFRVDRNISFL